MRGFYAVAVVVMLGMVLGGCSCNPLGPGFDVQGTYSGHWSTTGLEDIECPLLFTLDESGELRYRLPFEGTVRIGLDCATAQDGEGEEEEETENQGDTVQSVSGIIGRGGDITINSECGSNNECVSLTFRGEGRDTNNDGRMDLITGTINFQPITGFQFLSISTGTFEVRR